MHQLKEIQARQRSNFPLTLMEMEMETSIQESFFDHMLMHLHAMDFLILMEVEGDLYVDCHHTIEDAGIVLGEGSNRRLEIKRDQTLWIFHASNG